MARPGIVKFESIAIQGSLPGLVAHRVPRSPLHVDAGSDHMMVDVLCFQEIP